MNKEIIFIDITRGLKFYSDGTSNVTREQLQRLKQKNECLFDKCVALLKHNEEKALHWIEFQECKKENEQLKIECDMYKTYYRAKHDDIDGKIFKYKKALEEINLILDELKQQYDYMSDYSEIREIQDKINEVLDGR